jgi:hypothetical protein
MYLLTFTCHRFFAGNNNFNKEIELNYPHYHYQEFPK